MKEKINKLQELIATFHSNIKQYKSSAYDEANTRVDFIDKFFELLDWDVRNTQGFSEDFREVVREDTVYIAGKPKAPDYSFRQGGRRLFFVEAKKPMVDIKEALEPAFQLRRYAYTAKLPLSILTDFEEFAVYDTRIKPNQKDKASVARIFYCKYDEYLSPNKTDHGKTNLEYINAIFSKGEILKGSFKNFIDDTKRKSGTSEVDKEFLKLIEGWRTDLAKNIAIRNKDLDVYNLNTAVQKIIDRIIFIRIAEDRHMEEYAALLAISKEKNVYQKLDDFFQKADAKYNSGLFLIFDWISKLIIDDKVLSTIIQELYPPECPYEFSVLPIEILGNIYEQFLGKTIRLTPSHQAKVEEKPEVRKAGGVYYTPQYIVDYIVRNTVGEMLRRAQQPNKIEKIRILDPACGSGSFLVGAYNYLLNFHIAYYSKPANLKKAMKGGKIYRFSENTFRLSIQEKQRILLNNIYGVDIDHQAVEVTKLSLLLKLMENEQVESSGELFKHSDLKLLPDLSDNIRCGNSLIGSDFYADKELSLFGKEEMRKVNAFDWDKEFPEVFPSAALRTSPTSALREHTGTAHESKGKTDRSVSGVEPTGWGFDCVIGNPPYLRIQGLREYFGDQITYFIKKFQSAVKRFDIYLLFIEQGFNLLKENGALGYICPHKFSNSDFGSGIRKFLINNTALDKFISFGNNLIFEQASTYTGILKLKKCKHQTFSYYEFPSTNPGGIENQLKYLKIDSFSNYKMANFSEKPWILTKAEIKKVLDKLEDAMRMDEIFEEILVGVQSGIDNIHIVKFISFISDSTIKVFSERANGEIEVEAGLLKPLLKGDDVHRYEKPYHEYYCIYPYKLLNGKTIVLKDNEFKNQFPLGFLYLNKYKKELADIRKRQKTNPKYWYSCHRPRSISIFESIRIITPEISLGCNMTLSYSGIYTNTQVYNLLPDKSRLEDIKYWLGILNSKIMWWFLSNTGNVLRGGYFRFKTNYLNPFPMKAIDFSNISEKAQHDKMVSLVDQMLSAQKDLHSAKTEPDKEIIQKKIDLLDRQIDALVYELYGLTEEEIRIVEGG